jgi:hypothetical protein
VHTYASLLAIGAMLAHNPIGKYDQPIVYASRLLNKIKHNYTTIKRKALAMVCILHKFRILLLENNFFFYVNHMALIYLLNKPQVSRMITKWMLLFLEYEFTIVNKPSRTHVVVDVLSRLLNSSEPLGVLNQIVYTSLFSIEPIWMQEVKSYLKIGLPETLNLAQKQKLAKNVEPFIIKEGIMYIMGKDIRMHKCLTTS